MLPKGTKSHNKFYLKENKNFSSQAASLEQHLIETLFFGFSSDYWIVF